MTFINLAPFQAIITSYRLCAITGRFGGHKTSLAYKLAEKYLEQGYRLVSNNRSVWLDDMEKVDFDEENHLKTVVLLDEGGLYFRNNRQIEAVASYARKMDMIYLFPSFYPVARVAQVLSCQAIFNLNSAGLPLYFYRWRVKIGSFQDAGTFVWVDPSEIYGIYDTQDPGENGNEIVDWLIRKTEEFRRRTGRNITGNVVSILEETETDRFEDAVGALAEAADSFVAVSPKKRGRRKI